MPERNYDDAFFQHSNDERASRRSDESTSLGSRPHQYNTRQTARSTAARSRLNATQQQPRNAASYQKPGRYHRPPGPEQPRRRAVGIIASLLVVAAFAVGGYFVVQSLPASITLNGANLEVGGHKTLEDALSCGMDTRMSKPIDANEVTRMLARLLDSKNARNPR